MGRVNLITDQQAKDDPVLTELFSSAKELIGRVPNAMRTYAHLPRMASWLLALIASLQREGGGGTLDGRTKELIVLKTSMANECEYCKTHNTALGQATGLTLEQIGDLDGDYRASTHLSERDKAVARWAEAVTLNEAARDKAAFEALKKHFTESEIVEITWLAAMFNMLNRVHDSLLVDVEVQSEVDLIKKSKVTSEKAILAYAGRAVAAMRSVDKVPA